jgi:hypothetical protein
VFAQTPLIKIHAALGPPSKLADAGGRSFHV